MEQAKISSAHGAHSSHPARIKPAAQGLADSQSPSAAGGFLALLAALGGEGQDAELLELAEPGLEAPTVQPVNPIQDAAALAAWQSLLVPIVDEQPAGGGAAVVPGEGTENGAGTVAVPLVSGEGTAVPHDEIAMSAGISQGALASGVVPAGPAGGIGSGSGTVAGSISGVDGVPQGLVAETAVLDMSVESQGGRPSPGAAAGYGRALGRSSSALTQRADFAVASTVSRAGIGADAARHALGQPYDAAVAAFAPVPGDRVAPGVGERIPGGRIGAMGLEGTLPDGLLATAATARGGEAQGGGRPGEGAAGAWTDSGLTEALVETGGADAAFVDPAQMNAEEQVADRVAYWVHQKTQNAEVTLNRDGQPVEVLVSLSGNEAHVSFRSDQAQTRELLDQSMSQLRELLRSEGLVLSGMSVGTSAGHGAEGRNADSQRQRGEARQVQVVSAAPAGQDLVRRTGSSSNRAVDVFV